MGGCIKISLGLYETSVMVTEFGESIGTLSIKYYQNAVKVLPLSIANDMNTALLTTMLTLGLPTFHLSPS